MIESDDTDQICLIDSNIWLYAFLETEESDKSRAAKEVIQKAGTAITVSTQIINEVCVNLVRKMNFSEEKTRELIRNFYKKFQVIEINRWMLLKASEIRENHKFSFWDSLIFASAVYAHAEILYSEDMQDGFTVEKTRIINPF